MCLSICLFVFVCVLTPEKLYYQYLITGAVPWWHALGSWLWRAGHARMGERHTPPAAAHPS